MDIQAEKMLEALVDDPLSEMGLDSADDCYALRRIQSVMLEMKSSNNAEVLRQIATSSVPMTVRSALGAGVAANHPSVKTLSIYSASFAIFSPFEVRLTNLRIGGNGSAFSSTGPITFTGLSSRAVDHRDILCEKSFSRGSLFFAVLEQCRILRLDRMIKINSCRPGTFIKLHIVGRFGKPV